MKLSNVNLSVLVLIIVALLIFVCRETHKRHRFIEKMDEDRILDETEKQTFTRYWWDRVDERSPDASKLSNKSKVLLNTITDNPPTTISDNLVAKINAVSKRHDIPLGPKPLTKELLSDVSIGSILPILFDYQPIYKKSESTPSREQFEKDVTGILSKSYFGQTAKMIQMIIDNGGKPVPPFKPGDGMDIMIVRQLGPFYEVLTDLYGTKVVNEDLDGVNVINLKGPLQRNLVDIGYNYFYPTPDLFTWLQRLIFG